MRDENALMSLLVCITHSLSSFCMRRWRSCAETTADFTVALLLSVARRVIEAWDAVRK